ncbi:MULTISPECIES: hypothetical protein [unclassified Enterococcus]|jgi:hypothetical protein|uniref:hypothetical protein n=1 Tax=unclassified Enterococcus TaxID=2608891 RepID=UPI003D2B7624
MKKKIFLFFLICIVGVSIWLINRTTESSDITYTEFKETFGEDAWGHQLGIVNPEYGPMGENLIWDSETEQLIVEFDNFTSDAEFRLKLFWNYQEVEFSVDGGQMKNHYTFSLNYTERIELPINLSDNAGIDVNNEGFLGFLTANIFIEPNKSQKDLKLLDHDYVGINSVHYVFSDIDMADYDREKIFNPQLFQPYKNFPEDYFTLNVTTEYDELLNIPSTSITVKKGEKIDFNFVLGDGTGEKIDQYLLFALLGNDQIEINEQAMLHLHLPLDEHSENTIPQTGIFSIIAPKESGTYEFIAYAVGLPVEKSPYTNIENSFRITIVVE